MTLSAVLKERADSTPKKTCITFGNRMLSYAEIESIVSLVSGGLKSLGLQADEMAAILMVNCPEYIISYFAILRAGGIEVPVNPKNAFRFV